MGYRLHLKPSEASNDGSRRLRELLLRHTQRSVAKAVGCSDGAVGQYAREERVPEPEWRRQFEDELGIPALSWDEPNALRGGASATPAPSTLTREVPTERDNRSEAQRGAARRSEAQRGAARFTVTEQHRDLAIDLLSGDVINAFAQELERERVPEARRLAVELVDELVEPLADALARHPGLASRSQAGERLPRGAAVPRTDGDP